MPRIDLSLSVVRCLTDVVSIGQTQTFDSLANLAYLVRDRIDPLCLDQETQEALESAEDLLDQIRLAGSAAGGDDRQPR